MNKDITDYKFVKQLKALAFVEEIWLFGSRARGDNQDRSDIDIAVICPKATDNDWLLVLGIIEEADTLLKIDCVRFDTLQEDDPLKSNILRFKTVL
jgi:predicted nucleotidyltransferase